LTARTARSLNLAMMINILDRLSALSTEALAFVALDRAEAMARQWLGGNPSSAHAPRWLVARSLALELALSVPSVMGTTAFDRLARAMKGRSPDDIAAAALLRRSRIRLARISGRFFEDLATGETSSLLPTPFSDDIGDGVWFGLFTTLEEGHLVAPRTLVPLDDEALVLARSFVRPGNLGLGNGVRCAEAVYRHVVRNSVAPAATFGATSARKPKLPFRPDENRLDALAAAWARLGRDPNAQELAQARGFAGQDALMEVLLSVGIVQTGPKGLTAFFTEAGMAALRQLLLDRRAMDPARFAHLRCELDLTAPTAASSDKGLSRGSSLAALSGRLSLWYRVCGRCLS
jgi:hypothetical protein